jgi:hypothetical protein
MALHSSTCGCLGCQELGSEMGYPAFTSEGDCAPWEGEPNPLFVPGYFQPMAFGSKASLRAHRRGLGQYPQGPAYPPGVVKPAFPPYAMYDAGPGGPIEQMPYPVRYYEPRFIQDFDDAFTMLDACRQSPDGSGIAPTLSYNQAQQVASDAGYDTLPDGSIDISGGSS